MHANEVEKCLIESLKNSVNNLVCPSCWQNCSKLYRCSSCRITRYCGSICQHNDWKNHRLVCTKPHKITVPLMNGLTHEVYDYKLRQRTRNNKLVFELFQRWLKEDALKTFDITQISIQSGLLSHEDMTSKHWQGILVAFLWKETNKKNWNFDAFGNIFRNSSFCNVPVSLLFYCEKNFFTCPAISSINFPKKDQDCAHKKFGLSLQARSIDIENFEIMFFSRSGILSYPLQIRNRLYENKTLM